MILAHIHRGAAGTNGPVVVDFMEPVNGLNGCVQADAALIKDIRQDPAAYYVNVHTTNNAGGDPMRDGKCEGCHMKLIASTVMKVQTGKEIAQCEDCGRILYVEE